MDRLYDSKCCDSLHCTAKNNVQHQVLNNCGAEHELMDVVSDLDRSENSRDVVRRTPSVLQDVKADATISVHCNTPNHHQ